MLTFVVMPCLNEAACVEDAIASLLGHRSADRGEAHMVVVDNGSTDGTLGILASVARLEPGRVHVVEEAERGYVPPRRRGVAAVAEIARGMAIGVEHVLVLQADADTIYRRGYLRAMETAAIGARNVVLEGATRRPEEFAAAHPDYVAAERLVDAPLEEFEVADEDDVVVDDKICGYWLADYLRWGGLFDETDTAGERIHAETTRMFIRARLSAGAKKLRVNPAQAASSRRRVLEDARYQFATMGFPHGRAWRERVSRGWSATGVDDFARSVLEGRESAAVHLRQAHLRALFRYLPAVILSAEAAPADLLRQPDVIRVLEALPTWSTADLVERPGLALVDVLGLIDRRPDLFEAT